MCHSKILKTLKKGERIATIRQAIKEACELRYDVTLFFLIGSPGETKQDFEDSIKLAKEFPVLDVRFYNLIPYPHTELYNWVEDKDCFVRMPSEYLNTASVFINEPIFETPEFSAEARKKAFKQAEQIRKSILQTGLQKRFRKFGILGKLAARAASNERVLNMVRHSKLLRRVAEAIRGKTARQ